MSILANFSLHNVRSATHVCMYEGLVGFAALSTIKA